MQEDLSVNFNKKAIESVLDGDLSAILLTQQRSNYGSFLLSQSMSRNVIRDSKEDERMKGNLKASIGGLLG